MGVDFIKALDCRNHRVSPKDIIIDDLVDQMSIRGPGGSKVSEYTADYGSRTWSCFVWHA